MSASRRDGDLGGGGHRILAGERLGQASGAEVDRAGRVSVEPDLTLPGHPEVLAFGDMVRVRGEDGELQDLPGVAPVAMQQGRYAAKLVQAPSGRQCPRAVPIPRQGQPRDDRARVGRRGHPRRSAQRPFAWVTWLVVHLWYLVGFANRVLVLIRWSFSSSRTAAAHG